MKPEYIRQQLLKQMLEYTQGRNKHLSESAAAETYETKDEAFRRAAVFGLRMTSVAKVVDVLNGKLQVSGGVVRAYQHHMRDMAKLKYKERPAHMQSDQLDMEVMSQFFQSDDPEQNKLYQDMMHFKGLKAQDNTPTGMTMGGKIGKMSGYAMA